MKVSKHLWNKSMSTNVVNTSITPVLNIVFWQWSKEYITFDTTERSDVLTAVSMKTPVYQDVMPGKVVYVESSQQDVTYQMTWILTELLMPLITT